MSGGEKYWYNTKTGEVEKGHRSSWTHLLGPYTTREEAEQALARARSRNEEWNAQDDAD
ncbi:SPOR domain-containing protein [Myceligenerans indicum]|uniref:SPOR domain-containing protein n=1 Tax=Myceligenerans indicum TaxID=2593663 RepID=A0ABS1LJ26_9MICO|nr:SPOR domain-containing protein [Myceligenerans indicum]MBL0886241.1 SPOR domain-containing protein [Myceligenerans indicum]